MPLKLNWHNLYIVRGPYPVSALLFWAAVSGVLAAMVHLSVVLLIPQFAVQDAGHLLLAEQKTGELRLLSAQLRSKMVEDPALVVSACPYNLDDGPLRISTKPEAQEFLSIAFYQQGGTPFLR